MSATFAPAKVFELEGLRARHAVAEDFDANGRRDVIVVGLGLGAGRVYLLRAGGAPDWLGTPEIIDLGLSYEPIAIAAADMDGDGLIDIVTLRRSTRSVAPVVSVLRNLGGYSFSLIDEHALLRPPLEGNALRIQLADFTGNGLPDVAVPWNDTLSIFHNSGDGLLTPSQAITSVVPGRKPVMYGVAAADFTGNGAIDLVTADLVDHVRLYENDGSGMFSVRVIHAEDPDQPNIGAFAFVSVADFDDDGRPDIVVSDIEGDVIFLRNGGGGAFTLAARINVTTAVADPWDVVSADFNLDGKPDVAYAAFISNLVGVLRNDTLDNEFAFTGPGQLLGSGQPYSVLAADITGDERPDIIVTNTSQDRLVFIRNATVRRQRADFDLNNDGIINHIDMFEFFHLWMARDQRADFNGDGRIDGADLGLLLGMM